MVTFDIGSIGSKVDIDTQGLTIRGSVREDILQVVETNVQVLPIPRPSTYRVFLPLSHDEKLALASALKQAARKQRQT